MKGFFKPKILLSKTQKLPVTPLNHHLNYAVVVFSHHRDVQVALDDLDNFGLSHDSIVLIAQNVRRYSWSPKLEINNYFAPEKFDFNHIAQEFFLRLFQRRKYLVLITGNSEQVNVISKIMARRHGHAEAWLFESR